MMMKKITILTMSIFLLLGMGTSFAQDKYGAEKEKCLQNLSLFHESVKGKNFKDAIEPWKWSFENCPKASKLIYSDGLKIAKDMYTNGDKAAGGKLIDEIYTKRIVNFPDNLGKVYSDWASSLRTRGIAEDKVFEKLELAFKTDPSGMSIKNVAKFFKHVTEKNKDNNVQKVFDTYDDVMDAVNVKIGKLSKELDMLNVKDSTGQKLTKKEARKQKNHGINLKALGQAEGALDQILGEVATCDRLIPLYKKGFDAHKTDAKWLRRAASRLNDKECTNDAMYPKIVEAYVNADPSPSAYIFYATVLEKRGKKGEALKYRNKAVDLESDPYKKADYLYKIARTMYGSSARAYARKALKHRPSMGKAYLLIARAYAKSANSCGTDEFSKRMVYVAAVNKARRAKSVDPSISSTANKYIKSYSASTPSKKTIFTMGLKSGSPHKIGCWIGETVKVP